MFGLHVSADYFCITNRCTSTYQIELHRVHTFVHEDIIGRETFIAKLKI